MIPNLKQLTQTCFLVKQTGQAIVKAENKEEWALLNKDGTIAHRGESFQDIFDYLLVLM